MDKFIVRASILILNIYIVAVVYMAFCGIDISEYDFLFTDTVLFGVVLTTLCHTQGRYHCIWMRALCYNSIFVPTINFIDNQHPLFYTAEGYIYFIAISLSITIIATIILAIRHFIRVIRVKRLKKRNNYGIEQRRKGEIRQSFSRNEVSRNIHDGCDKSRDIRQM